MKKIDVGVLPDGFLCERKISGGFIWDLAYARYCNSTLDYRPALNIDHFNDGSMVLPDGLVVSAQKRDGELIHGFTKNRSGFTDLIVGETNQGKTIFNPVTEPDRETNGYQDYDCIAVKILGVTEEYGAQLGMEVIEL